MTNNPQTPDLTITLVREVTPEDRHLLEIGYNHLSTASRYFRFLGARRHLTTRELDSFTSNNGPDHVAVGALFEGMRKPKPVGIARFCRLSDQPEMAEIAITITDTFQGQGLGSLLLGVLAKFAKQKGISEFYALVHRDNMAMLCLLARLGGTQTSLGGAEIEVRVPILRDSTQLSPSSVRDAFMKVDELADIASSGDTKLRKRQTSERQIDRATISQLTDDPKMLDHTDLRKPFPRAVETRQILQSHRQKSGFTGADQSISVWADDGGAIV